MFFYIKHRKIILMYFVFATMPESLGTWIISLLSVGRYLLGTSWKKTWFIYSTNPSDNEFEDLTGRLANFNPLYKKITLILAPHWKLKIGLKKMKIAKSPEQISFPKKSIDTPDKVVASAKTIKFLSTFNTDLPSRHLPSQS